MKRLTYEQVKANLNSRMYENGVRFSKWDQGNLQEKGFNSMIEAIVDSINENIDIENEVHESFKRCIDDHISSIKSKQLGEE